MTSGGVRDRPASLGGVILQGAGGMLTFLAAISGTSQLGTEIELWANATPPSIAHSSIDLAFPTGALVYFTSIASFCGATHVEMVTCGASIAAHIDRPVAADGSRLGPSMPGTLAIYQTASINGVVVTGTAPVVVPPPAPIALALHNALLTTTPPAVLLVAGTFSTTPTELDSGGLLLAFGLESVLPTLPDPYAANFLPVRSDSKQAGTSVSSELLAIVLWSPATAAALNFSDTTLTPGSVRIQQLAPRPRRHRPAPPASRTRSGSLRWSARSTTTWAARAPRCSCSTSPATSISSGSAWLWPNRGVSRLVARS
jgi:disulfide bond formation protein DsbB